jgi:predicted aminopeptidase
LTLALTGCIGPGYYAESLNGHLNLMAARKDVARLIADPATPAALRGADADGKRDQAVCQ